MRGLTSSIEIVAVGILSIFQVTVQVGNSTSDLEPKAMSCYELYKYHSISQLGAIIGMDNNISSIKSATVGT